MRKLRLGLDVGTNSLGWCLLELNETGEPTSVFKTGVRIFSDGRDPKSLGSLKANRREARSTRRRRDRFLQRQKYLINTLVKRGLMPLDDNNRKALAFNDPYEIRKNALDHQVEPYEMGRAIFHINQRRGFKSNRKSSDNEAGVVKQSIAQLELKLAERGAKTIGEFLADRKANNETVRARRLGAETSDLYELYPDRYMLEKEMDLLWDKQSKYNPSLYTEDLKNELKGIIFFQRKLKAQEIGRCSFIPEEDRIAKALPTFQRFRIYQELSNLAWIDRAGVAHSITSTPGLRDRLFSELENKKKLTFKSMRAILKKEGVVEYPVSFNLESDLREHLEGNLTSCVMRHKERMGSSWDELDEETQDELILMLLDDKKDDDEVRNYLSVKHKLNAELVEACLDARLPYGHGSLSKKAIDTLNPIMRDQGLIYYDAVKEAGFGEANQYDPNAPLSDQLDYYGKVLAGHVIGGSGKPEHSDEQRYGTISNPSVHISINQIRAVVNELIKLYGKPKEIVLELARDLPMGVDGKRELQKIQKKGLEKNQRARAEIVKQGFIDSRESRQKYQLWEQLASDPTQRCCPFTGKVISISDLFSASVEIEHLLPFSETLDDSMANKTVCFREANREKGKRSPFEAFGTSPEGYDWEGIMGRVMYLPSSKRWRFLPDAMKRFETEGGFREKQLNDTRYISRYARRYLSTIVNQKDIWVVTGRLTSLLRGFWGLNSILSGHNKSDDQPAKKTRDDHRHHAVDAVVIAMTSRSLLQRVSKSSRRSEELNLSRLFEDRIDPWDSFRDEVKEHINNIIVSHRSRKKDRGSLHKETPYGIIEYNSKAASKVVHRVPIIKIKKKDDLSKIRDQFIRNALIEIAGNLSGQDFEQAVQNWCKEHNVKSLRIVETISVIPIKDKLGNKYKGYKGDSNAYMEIYQDLSSSKWESEIISRFDANQPGFIPEWRKAHPAQKMLMRLRINDMIHFKDTDEIFRIQQMSGSALIMAPHTVANADARNRDKEDSFKFLNIAPSILKKRGAVKIHISPTGLISEGR